MTRTLKHKWLTPILKGLPNWRINSENCIERPLIEFVFCRMPSLMQSPSLASDSIESLFCSGSTLSFEDKIKIKNLLSNKIQT